MIYRYYSFSTLLYKKFLSHNGIRFFSQDGYTLYFIGSSWTSLTDRLAVFIRDTNGKLPNSGSIELIRASVNLRHFFASNAISLIK